MVKFSNRDNSTEEEMSVADYFKKQYFELKHPHLPLVEIRVRDQQLYFPIEVLEVAPMQRYSPKLNEAMTASMIKIAAKKPDDRFRIIQQKAEELRVFSNELLSSFGVAFDNKFTNCKGMILPPPVVKYSNTTVQVSGGSWNLRDVAALRPVEIGKWKVFYFRGRDRLRNDVLDKFIEVATRYGIRFPREHPVQEQISVVDEFFASEKEEFNMVVLPDKSAMRYEEIKRVAETYTGHVTQCVLGANASSKMANPNFIGNILLKINAKMGGENHSLSEGIFSDKATMLIGLNVQHPGVTDVDSPTVVAAVGSIDYDFVNYKTVIGTQKRRTEIVASLKETVTSLLRAHFTATKKKPERIVFFRDGLGDSAFEAVFTQEISAMKEALAAMEKNYHPELNFIVAQKRHSVRFAGEQDMGNLAPGTLVGGMGNEAPIDFFLVSAHALQGTARPTRYKVLLNESGFTQEALHTSIFSLCHLYARATKSVSVVPPIYYANLAAVRGKAYFERNEGDVVEMRDVIRKISSNLFYL
ncbi:AGO5 [Enterospora canceri]|uniref:AGO5 n=1 Tax=Enterospora canceri TaxID=1081671 RepID=A0A1Y1S8Z8_9MICR|nr:AGO5 [Enterospora canceri]